MKACEMTLDNGSYIHQKNNNAFYEHKAITNSIFRFQSDKTKARISGNDNLEFSIHFFKDASSLHLTIKGPASGIVPYATSIVINTVEYCKDPEIVSIKYNCHYLETQKIWHFVPYYQKEGSFWVPEWRH